MPVRTFYRLGLVACAALLVTGCSILKEDKIDYKSAERGSTLDVPPDLTQLNRDSRYVVPGAAVTASGYQTSQTAGANAPGAGTAPVQVGDVRIERAGSQRWLVVDRPPAQLWGPIRDFWQENGFLIDVDQETLGIMETDWAENRAKIPQDIIRSTIGKLFDSLYSTGERDKFRTRLERNTNGGTEIYVTHRGMAEVYTNREKDSTVWQPRPADPELEAEFLRRLMVKLGVSEAQAQSVAATAPTRSNARVVTVDNQPAVQFNDNFDRAWRRVGLSLDRSGFTVEDRNRSEGTYFVRYVEPVTGEKPGFFSRMFGAEAKEAKPQRYRIVVKTAGELTTVKVLDGQGNTDATGTAQRIAQLLAADLN
ncbi:MAG: outer membrane protein assembly factor BamC [Hydrogenophaga sp.]|uniref:outer membrane protein assembly factor BamC n=1 Tax=Hydrogenophaga sp. TaxID=1904254 RepID=UPI001DC6CCAB|nr:outer membrane protein assembly factor BamC [Hydrogenophaga sp.]MBX3609971.1 outer membrane protein assembly factor BamC [Hydrogenophaga sp.]